MQVINWLELQPLLADVDMLNARLCEALPVHSVCRSLVDITLHGFPWKGRSDLIPCYHPARTYRQGQWIALPVPDPEEQRPTPWQVAQVKIAESTGNSIQGRFQALVLDVGGREVQKTAGIAGATYPEPGISGYSSEDLGWLSEWVANTYTGALLGTLRRLIKKGRINGQLTGETFLPEQMFALSVERLDPLFARLSHAQRWLSIEEMLLGLPDLSELKHETALALVRSTLKVSSYRSLGGDRWTTPEIYEQLDRHVPFGLPGEHVHSRIRFWTGQDKKDLAACRSKSLPEDADCMHDGSGKQEGRLSPLSALQITQAYFPVDSVLDRFGPDSGMVFVQFIEGEYQPFLLDRDQGLLKAVHPETLQTQILEQKIPAGTHLWLEHQGGDTYRIAPLPLTSPCWVPARRALLRNGNLHIELTRVLMNFEGETSLFVVDITPEEIRSLHAEAERDHLSIRDALIYAIQELCAAGPRKVAGRADILNTVFLLRPCSRQAATLLLHNLSCFDQLPGNQFRFLSQARGMNIWRGDSRITQLWEDLAVHCLAPDPVAKKAIALCVETEPDMPSSLHFAPAEVPGSLAFIGLGAEKSAYPAAETRDEDDGREKTFLEKAGLESVHLIQHVLEVLTAPVDKDPIEDPDGGDDPEMPPVDPEALEETPLKSLPEPNTPVFFPAMVRVSMEPDPQPGSIIDTRAMAHGLKIPARPLHKRPIHQRLLFCLRAWIHAVSGNSHEPSLR